MKEFALWKGKARDDLSGKWPTAVAVTFLRVLAEFLLVELVDLLFPAAQTGFSIFCRFVGTFLVLVFSEVLAVGIRKIFLDLSDSAPVLFSDLFFGFSNMPDRILWWAMLMAAFDSLALSVPLFFVTRLLRSPDPAGLLGLLGSAALSLVLLVQVRFRYVLYPYHYLRHPQKSLGELFRQSASSMQGRKKMYLLLQLSFAGFWCLGILSLGIGFLWLTPYRVMTEVLFWKSISSQGFTDI